MGNVLILGAKGYVADSLINHLETRHKLKCIDREQNNNGIDHDFTQIDVSDAEQFREYLISINDDDFPDFLINLSGHIISRALLETLINDKHSFKIDLIAHLKDFGENLDCQVIPMLVYSEELIKRRKKGRVINFSSLNSKGVFGQFGYSSAKATIEAMTKNLALELGIHGIQANCISPGYLNLPNLLQNMNDNGINRAIQQSALKKLVDVKDVCLAVDFLMSTSGVSGTTIQVHSSIG